MLDFTRNEILMLIDIVKNFTLSEEDFTGSDYSERAIDVDEPPTWIDYNMYNIMRKTKNDITAKLEHELLRSKEESR